MNEKVIIGQDKKHATLLVAINEADTDIGQVIIDEMSATIDGNRLLGGQ